MGNGVYKFSMLAKFPEIFQGVSMKVSAEGNFWDMLEPANREAFLTSVAGTKGATRMLWAQQCHGDTIFVYRPDDPFPSLPLPNTDAFITSAKEVGLLVKIADCQPILLYDPTRRIVGAVHSGWRGSIKNILGKTVQRMEGEFGVNPQDVYVAIGPSLGPCCATFSNPDQELPPEILKHRRDEKRIDFWRLRWLNSRRSVFHGIM